MPRKFPGKIAGSDPLRRCERWSTNVVWSAPIDMRLSALVRLAVEDGAEQDSLTRSELVAALVLAAPADGARLHEMLVTYRTAKAADASVAAKRAERLRAATRESNVIVLEDRKPGRRPR
jgi:hypothetical protein